MTAVASELDIDGLRTIQLSLYQLPIVFLKTSWVKVKIRHGSAFADGVLHSGLDPILRDSANQKLLEPLAKLLGRFRGVVGAVFDAECPKDENDPNWLLLGNGHDAPLSKLLRRELRSELLAAGS
jgi:hypothetical protein